MILDGIIALFGALIVGMAALAGALFEVVPLLVNLFAALAEGVIGLFVSGFTLGRMARKKKEPAEPKRWTTAEIRLGMLGGLAVILVLGWAVLAPQLMGSITSRMRKRGRLWSKFSNPSSEFWAKDFLYPACGKPRLG